ncbi:MAG: DUF429 domain-containing protein [Chloroflexi bacterium]|nr:MAG: DUF429 domain-containing protein [Chloroflexota bacterium]
MYFVGIDLAWSYRNTTGVAVLRNEGEKGLLVAWNERLRRDEEIVSFIEGAVGGSPALIAIDAPLVVPNETGTRPCDRELSRLFRRYEAGAHPANRRKFGGIVRGEELVQRLSERGFVHSPQVAPRKEVRQVIEVYPHPAAITLFGLEKTIKYKARPGRTYEFRWSEMNRYRRHLQALESAEPALEAREILNQAPEGLKGQALKCLEDLLDALFCAYIALYCWHWGPERYRVIGDLERGYIIVPNPVGCPLLRRISTAQNEATR